MLDLDAVGPGQTINVDEDILWAAGYTGDVESRRIWFDSLDPYHKAAFGKYLLRDVAKSAWKNAQESPEDADAHKRYLHAMGQYQRAVIFNPSLPHLKPPNFYYEDLELIDSPVDDVDVIQEVEYQAGSSDEDDAHWGGAELHDNKSQYESTTRGALDSKRDVPLAGAVNRKTLEVDESVTSDYHDELGHPPRDPITVRRYYGTEDLAFIPMDTPPLEVFTYIGVRDEAPRTTGKRLAFSSCGSANLW